MTGHVNTVPDPARMMRAQLLAVLLTAAAAPLAAQTTPSPAALTPGGSVSITPGSQYRAGWLHRLFFGDHYRDLWTTPIRVEVLDLSSFGGGLTPIKKGGGKQTASLRFKAKNGREYGFRSVNKDPAPLLPPELRETLVESIFQDQISAAHPAGALVVPPLLAAVGVRAAPPRLLVMPDDPALGEFRQEFAGMLGTLEERATEAEDGAPGFLAAVDVKDTEEMFEKLDRSTDERVDTRGFLAARLMDLFLGDWDRHVDQWKWVQVGSKDAPYQPVPYDRDQAFVRYDGFLLDLARVSGYPQLVDFGKSYPSMTGLHWNARFIDRRLLIGLERPTWDSVAGELQAKLTDAVIDDAVRRLPSEYYEKDGARMATALKSRRDQLPEAAGKLYRLLAGQVDVRATSQDEVATARRAGDGSLELTVADRRKDGTLKEPYFRRRFLASETKDVRLFMLGGADSVLSEGSGGPPLKVIGGEGADVLHAPDGGARLYDEDADSRAVGAGITRKPYRTPDSTSTIEPAPRDWGKQWRFVPWLSYEPDVGLFFGGGASRYGYGFRKDPYASWWRIRAGYAATAAAPRADLLGEIRRENSPLRFQIYARASGIEVVRFFGFGNSTPLIDDEISEVEQEQYQLSLGLAWPLARRLMFSVGPIVRYSTTDLDQPNLIGQVQPYGSGDFGQLGAQAGLEYDSRDSKLAATRGARVLLGGSVFPELWDVQSTFGEVHGEASTYLTAPIPLRPTLALRAAGKYVSGDYPFHEAAHIGGAGTVRGLREHRYIGDYSAWGNAELRLSFGRARIVLPAEVGIFGLADAGRVWLEGEDSDEWHEAFGGGIWLAFLSREGTITAAIARGEGRNAVYVRAGFAY
ncbi:MAG: BamA/TamA family outer membrane protein [Gemmatimonadales bacterium]